MNGKWDNFFSSAFFSGVIFSMINLIVFADKPLISLPIVCWTLFSGLAVLILKE